MSTSTFPSSRLARFAIASLPGVAFGVAAPPSAWSALGWLALVPLLALLRSARPARNEALALGLASGLGVGLFGFPWIAEFVQNFAGFPGWLALVGLLLFSIWLAVPYALFAWGASLGPRRGLLSFVWPIALLCALLEHWPVVFPYTPAIGLASVPAWIQLAELGGVRMVESQIVLSALFAARALVPHAPGLARRAGWAAAAIALPLVSFGLGTLRMQQIEREARDAPTLRVGIVQPNMPVISGDREEAVRRLRMESLRAEADGAELVIWPEAGTYPYPWQRPVESDSASPRSRVNVDRSTPTLLGVITYEKGSPFPYNSIVYLAPEGDVRGVFDKVELLVFGEYVPFVSVEWAKIYLQNVGQLSRGAGPVRFDVEIADGRRIGVGPLVCYEDIISAFAHQVAVQDGGIQLFVNATIDAWYGEGKEPWEHLALAQFRSVEHRIPLVRSVSTGVSAVVDATGRQQAVLPARITPPGETPRFESEVLVQTVALARSTLEDPTPFARLGWVYPWLCTFACAVLAVVFRLRRAQPEPEPRL